MTKVLLTDCQDFWVAIIRYYVVSIISLRQPKTLFSRNQERLNAYGDVLPWRTVADAQQELSKRQSEDDDGSLVEFVSDLEEFLGELLQ